MTSTRYRIQSMIHVSAHDNRRDELVSRCTPVYCCLLGIYSGVNLGSMHFGARTRVPMM